MIKNKKTLIIFLISVITYIISDFFFNDAIYYLVGGVLGYLLKIIGLKSIIYFFWIGLIFLLFITYKKSYNVFLKGGTLILLWFLLYIVDAILYQIIPDLSTISIKYSTILVAVFLKSVCLTYTYIKSKSNDI